MCPSNCSGKNTASVPQLLYDAHFKDEIFQMIIYVLQTLKTSHLNDSNDFNLPKNLIQLTRVT